MESTDSSTAAAVAAAASQQPQLPPGFRFHPTDEELVVHYLKRKSQSAPLPVSIIAEVDLYKFDPWELPAKATFGEQEWYFFSPRDRKYPNGARPNRAATSGYWKATGTDKPVLTSTGESGTVQKVGVKKALVFYGGKPPRGLKTNWIMHEYRLADNKPCNKPPPGCDPNVKKGSLRLDDWVLCRIYKKSNTHRTLDHERDDPLLDDHHHHHLLQLGAGSLRQNAIPAAARGHYNWMNKHHHPAASSAGFYAPIMLDQHNGLFDGMLTDHQDHAGYNISNTSSAAADSMMMAMYYKSHDHHHHQLPVTALEMNTTSCSPLQLPLKRTLPSLFWNSNDTGDNNVTPDQQDHDHDLTAVAGGGSGGGASSPTKMLLQGNMNSNNHGHDEAAATAVSGMNVNHVNGHDQDHDGTTNHITSFLGQINAQQTSAEEQHQQQEQQSFLGPLGEGVFRQPNSNHQQQLPTSLNWYS